MELNHPKLVTNYPIVSFPSIVYGLIGSVELNHPELVTNYPIVSSWFDRFSGVEPPQTRDKLPHSQFMV